LGHREEAFMAEMHELVTAFYDRLWNAGDDEAVEGVLSADFAFRGTLGTQTQGRHGWRAYRDTVRAGAPDFHNEVVSLVVEGDTAAARLSYSGTHLGCLVGVPPTGKAFEYAGAVFFTADAGLLTSAWALGDLDALRQRLRPRPL
jgi:steroid delta-isomerase-like uncharacterized protein